MAYDSSTLKQKPSPEQVPTTTVRQHLVLSPSDPLRSARRFIARYYTQDSFTTLHYHRGGFYTYTGTHYRETDNQELRSRLYKFLEQAKRRNDDGCLVPFEPNQGKVSNVMDALKAETFLRSEIDLPVWLDDSNIPADEILACKNGLLHLPTQGLIEHTPSFFGYESLPFDYDPEAGAPTQWLKFLNELWPHDPDSIRALQEWFGYCLCTDTRQQKILLIVGPKRSGKGTIGRIQRKLLGKGNVCAPTLSGLTTNFGLQPLIGKRLAIVSDARLGKRTDQSTVAERLLSISGEDAITIDRKHRTAWSGTLPTRFMILTNELPRIWDSSGALANRFIVLVLTESFLGREDIELTDHLATELPGILNWANYGWACLQRRGHILQPASSAEVISELEYLGSPVSEFIRDRCLTGPEFSVPTKDLFEAWKQWCQSQGNRPGIKATFGKDLKAALPGNRKRRPQIDGKPTSCYQGITLRD